jgi:hypothetical protein
MAGRGAKQLLYVKAKPEEFRERFEVRMCVWKGCKGEAFVVLGGCRWEAALG